MPIKKSFIILFFFSVVYAAFVLAAEQVTLDFVVPAPPNSKSENTPPIKIAGREILTAAYQSEDNQYPIANFYERFFRNNGFKQVLDRKIPDELPQFKNRQEVPVPGNLPQFKYGQDESLPKMALRQIRYKRDEVVVDLYLSAADKGTYVSIMKYLQKEGEPNLEDSKLSVTDSLKFDLPTQDYPGEDISVVPRPPQSVRLAIVAKGKLSFLTYSSPLSIEEIKDFYKIKMPSQAWELKNEIGPEQRLNAAGKADINIPAPFLDGEDFKQAVNDSFSLDFNGRYGEANITILPNFVDRKLGSLVQVIYSEPE